MITTSVKVAQKSPGRLFMCRSFIFHAMVPHRMEEHMKANQKSTKKTFLAIIALLVVLAALFGVYRSTRGTTDQGAKTITVDVIHGDGALKTFEYHTDREYLGEVLTDEELVSGESGAYGLFITTVDGETADDANQEWWCITKNNGQLNTSADQTPIADGEKYELTLTTGYSY